MDPNAALARIRELADNLRYENPGSLSAEEDFLDAVADLDEWMSKGGFPPVAWDPDVTRRT